MYAFTYHRPATARQAAGLLARREDSKLLAGGHTLLPAMKARLAAPSALIDLSECADLKGITLKGRNIVIGAMTTHGEVANSPIVQQAAPALAHLASLIGDPAVRHRGTIGGSVANNDPAADYPAALIAMGATVTTNRRKLAAADFFTGLYETALEEGEIITKIAFPAILKAGYAKFRNPASRYAMVGVFVAKRGPEVRVAVIGAGEGGVFRWPEAEAALKTRFTPKSLDGLKHTSAGINGDMHADPEYRAHLIGVMAKQAVAQAVGK